MKKFMRRTAALILAMVMIISLCRTNVYADNLQSMQSTEMEAAESEANRERDNETSEIEIEPETGNETGREKSETLDDRNEAGPESENEPNDGKAAPLVNIVTLDNTYIEAPGTQNIVVDIGSEETRIESAVLQYKNPDGEKLSLEAAEIMGGTLLFTITHEKGSITGIYRLEGISYNIDGNEYAITFAEIGINVIYGVDMTVETEPDDYLIDEEILNEIEANTITLDEEGNLVSETTLEDVLEQADAGTIGAAAAGAKSVGATGAADNLVIMLDPGHDSTHAGASYYGYHEESLVLKIAKYCKEELEKYPRIKVYMTRTGEACPNGGNAVSSGTCNYQRVEYAKKVKADLYVSFHLNASYNTDANGVGVYYPNSNYNPEIGRIGSELAQKIYEKLHALGIGTWAGGKLIWNSQTGTLYPDGSLADYLSVIKNSKQAGITAVLIEHAFLSNESDVDKFLSSNAKLKKLGAADAKAIAEYYGRKKVTAPPTPAIAEIKSKNSSQLSITWNNASGATGYEIYRSTTQTGSYSKIATLTPASSTAYTDNVTTGKTCYYKVRAYKTAYGLTAYSSYSQVAGGKTLAKPAVTKVQSQGGGSLLVEWNKIGSAAGYQIQRSTSKNGTYTKIATVKSGNTTSYTDSGIKTNTTYYYRVRAYQTANGVTGYGSYSAALNGKAVSKTTITAVQSAAGGKLKINWKKISGANGYLIYRSTSEKGTYKKIATVTSGNTTSYTDAGTKTGTTYYYKIKARNKVNGTTGYGSYSSVVKGKAVNKTSISSVQSAAGGKLKVTWKKIAGANGYLIYRSTSEKGTYKKIATVTSGNTTSYTDIGIKTGTTYYYKVKVRNKVSGTTGYSSYSNAVKGKAVGKTSISSVKSAAGGKLKITWKKVSGANGYLIYRSTSGKGTYKKIATVTSGNTTSYTDTGIKTGTAYYYKIKVRNKVGGNTGYSSYSGVVKGMAVGKGSIHYVQSVSGGNLKIEWKKVSGASGYQIQRSTTPKGKYETIATVTSGKTTTYTDKTVKTNKNYYYKVRAFNKVNGVKGYGNYSAAVYGKAVAKTSIHTIKANNSQKITLTWKKVSGASGYVISRSTSVKGTYKKIATIKSGNTVTYEDTNLEAGKSYYYKINVQNRINGITGSSGACSPAGVFVLAQVQKPSVKFTMDGNLQINWKKISSADGYQIYRSTSKSGGYSNIKTIPSGSTIKYEDTSVIIGKTYYYRIRAYYKNSAGTTYGGFSTIAGQAAGYEIMGKSSVTAAKMAAYYNANATYPAFYKNSDAPDLITFCTIYLEECEAEGVKAEVAFCQAMKETGFLRYPGDVKIKQYNFAGLGATGNGVQGNSFKSVRIGIRAQVQHLKAYASTEALKNTCVDDRFSYVTRGCAAYVEWLGIKENPTGRGWAADAGYGYSMRNGYIAKLLSY